LDSPSKGSFTDRILNKCENVFGVSISQQISNMHRREDAEVARSIGRCLKTEYLFKFQQYALHEMDTNTAPYKEKSDKEIRTQCESLFNHFYNPHHRQMSP
jgi:hypothetical protein